MEKTETILGFDASILEILRQANEGAAIQNQLFGERLMPVDQESNAEGSFCFPSAVSDFQDPLEAHINYYRILEYRYKRPFVGKRFPKVKDMVYAQIRLFLKEGFEKGRDGRQARPTLFRIAVETFQELENSGQINDCVAIYSAFVELNKKYNFHT